MQKYRFRISHEVRFAQERSLCRTEMRNVWRTYLTKTKRKTAVRYGGKQEEEEKEEANREGEAKERACFSARDVLRLLQTRLNSPDANTPIPVTREALPNGIIRWIYLLPRDPEKTSRGSPCGTLEKEAEIGNRSDTSSLFEIDTLIAMEVGMNICSAYAGCIYLI